MRTPSRGRREGQRQQPGRGFTLIELLVVIVIISALVALLLPAILSARSSVRNAQVQAEISRLGSALADFKAANHNIYPPSSIRLFEAAAGWTTPAALPADESARLRSVALIRQLWPQFNFSIDRDINNDTDTADTLDLTKGECLVFFLGGMPDTAANSFAPLGFSQNPANPFLITGSNREGPYFEFDVNRYSDTDGDGMPEFRDTLPDQTAPYLYFSAYEGQGYLALRGAALPQPAGAEPPTQLVDVYLQGGTSPWNPRTFQIISPGGDAAYGSGGVFNPDTASADLVGARDPERDNITNFHNGRLAPN